MQAVNAADAALPFGLHCELRELYTVCDGFLLPSGVGVYEASALVERNRTFEVAEFAPGFVLFGDDSGGRGFLLHAPTPDSPVYGSDLGDLDPSGFEVLSPGLRSWLLSLSCPPGGI